MCFCVTRREPVRGRAIGRTSWTAWLDAIRPEPGADLAAVTADDAARRRRGEAAAWRKSTRAGHDPKETA
ncbi:hypothetical protein GCM10010343_32760 [Streptomyces avidinii]|nr:hypothetical protein GCM10010343_32760 [Streptomyces avidinii]